MKNKIVQVLAFICLPQLVSLTGVEASNKSTVQTIKFNDLANAKSVKGRIDLVVSEDYYSANFDDLNNGELLIEGGRHGHKKASITIDENQFNNIQNLLTPQERDRVTRENLILKSVTIYPVAYAPKGFNEFFKYGPDDNEINLPWYRFLNLPTKGYPKTFINLVYKNSKNSEVAFKDKSVPHNIKTIPFPKSLGSTPLQIQNITKVQYLITKSPSYKQLLNNFCERINQGQGLFKKTCVIAKNPNDDDTLLSENLFMRVFFKAVVNDEEKEVFVDYLRESVYRNFEMRRFNELELTDDHLTNKNLLKDNLLNAITRATGISFGFVDIPYGIETKDNILGLPNNRIHVVNWARTQVR